MSGWEKGKTCRFLLQSDVVEGKPGVAEAFVEVDGDVSRSTSGNRVMGMSSGADISMGVGRNVCGEEGKSDDWEREQEMHLW